MGAHSRDKFLMKGATRDDQEIADIILWLLVTDQEAHVDRYGDVTVRRSRHAARRAKRREGTARLTAAEEKRLRKQAKRLKSCGS